MPIDNNKEKERLDTLRDKLFESFGKETKTAGSQYSDGNPTTKETDALVARAYVEVLEARIKLGW